VGNNRHFKRFSAVFKCRICGRSTRDTNGDNGGVLLCEDCFEGAEQENGYNDASDPASRAQYERGMRECFQRAVNKGGKIKGYTAAACTDQQQGTNLSDTPRYRDEIKGQVASFVADFEASVGCELRYGDSFLLDYKDSAAYAEYRDYLTEREMSAAFHRALWR